MKILNYKSAITIFFFVFVTLGLASISSPVFAVYDGGNIIDDYTLLNASTMNASDIQSFLISKGGGIANKTFLFDCSATDASEVYYKNAGAPCGTVVPASTIIYYASQIYGINPKAVLAMVQKEQSLVTTTNPTDWQINQAMGYGCPTNGGCSASNFLYQIDNGVWVIRLSMERARGNMTWWFTSSSWVCGYEHAPPSHFYSPNLYPNQNVNFYDQDNVYYRTHHIENAATSSFYCYTPHAYNNPSGLYGLPAYGTTGRYYSGSYNFVSSYEAWFGSTNDGPKAFKTADSSIIYIPVNGYKLVVPYGAVMQDYGISYESIKTIGQSYIDSMPIPPVSTGISQSIGHVVKSSSDSDSDGGSVYLMSRGRRYKIQSMQQFYDFGFTDSDISYLPLDYILYSMVDGKALSNFVTSPYGNVFKVDGQVKQIIFEYKTYINQNPSDNITPLSYYLINKIPSGNPITDRPILLKNKSDDTVSLYQNGSYYPIPDYDVFTCWGLNDSKFIPTYRIPQNDYIGAYTPQSILSCVVNDGQNNLALNNTSKLIIPSFYGLIGTNTGTELKTLLDKMTTRTTPLKKYIKTSDSAAVWDIENGKRKVIPSYLSFLLLGLNSDSIDIINQNVLNQIPTNGIKLAEGQLVKDPSSAAIYVIGKDERILFPSSDLFTAYGNKWNTIETYPTADLNLYYPISGTSVSDYLANISLGKAYIIGQNGCFELTSSTLSALNTNYATLLASQPYSSTIFKNLNPICGTSTNFLKLRGQSVVYWIDSGKKYALNTYTAMLNKNGGQEPIVVEVTSAFLANIPTGEPYY